MNEAEFTTKIKKDIESLKYINHTAAIEYKAEKNLTFNLKAWIKSKPQQFKYVCNRKCGPVYHKISDQSEGTKPGDSFLIVNEPGYLIIWFDKAKKFMIIDDEEVWRLTKTTGKVKFDPDRAYSL